MLALFERASHGLLRVMGAESRYVVTDTGRVHAHELAGLGDGTDVLLHGLGVSGTAYTAVARRLRPRARRILLVDLPGHGKSSEAGAAVDVNALAMGLEQALDQLIDAGEPAVLLGTSLGGAAALGYALARPERIRALLLVSPAGAPLSDEEIAALRSRFDLKERQDARRFIAELLHRPRWYMRLIERGLVEQLRHPRVRSILAGIGAEHTFTEERLAALAPPTVVLWGKSDRILPRSALAFYRRALPAGTRFVEIDAVGHSPHYEQPALVARHLLEAFGLGSAERAAPAKGASGASRSSEA
jgi:pimeloyl-ACP methyl ester carboxylesterase